MSEHGRLARAITYYSTREVSEQTGVQSPTLQLWVREGRINPKATGEGRLRRLSWTDDDVAVAVRIRDEGKTVVAVNAVNQQLDGRFLQALMRAQEAKENCLPHEIVAANSERARIFRDDVPIRDLRKALSGIVIVLS